MASYRADHAIQTVAAIGAGVIGAGWVATFLGSGRGVRLHDPGSGAQERTRAHVERAWPQMVALGHADAHDDWHDRLTFHETVEDAVSGADFVQESVPEKIDLKRDLFAALDRCTPDDVLIASSTSSFAITTLAQGCANPRRFVLGHPFNPVHLIPLVEVGGGEQTERSAVETAFAFYSLLGKSPVQLEREVFGHLANRLASAMFREAVSLVADGVASVEDVDRAIRNGPALKWAIQGQFTTFHTSGGAGGLAEFLPKYAPGIVQRWKTMRDPDLEDDDVQSRLISQMQDAAAGRSVEEIARTQDAALLALLKLLEGAARPAADGQAS